MNENHPAPRTLPRLTLIAALIAASLICLPLRAQDISGTWQGAFQQANKEQRIVVKISKDAAAGWQGVVYSLNSYMPFEGRATTQMNLQGSDLRFAIAAIDSSFQGRLSEDAATLTGTWTQTGTAYPLNLARVTADAAWDIPKADSLMANNADPGWDVVTVRPRDPGNPSGSQSTGMKGSQFTMVNRTVEGMLLLAYGLHKKEIVGAPAWIETERWDVRGVPDVPGHPNLQQAQTLTRKLLEERFGLKVHRETRELPVYAITLARGGEKLARSAGNPNGPPDETDSGNGWLETMRLTNMTMSEFAPDLGYFLDRPAVDQTGLTGRYDFLLRFTADESKVPADENAPPGLFTAIQQQLGLKLDPTRAKKEVLVVDAVQRPSAN